MKWYSRLSYRVMDAARSRKADAAARESARAADFGGLRGARQALVVTFKRSGEPVPTPVNVGMSDDGRIYFRSEPDVAKVRRIRNNPRVLVGPCGLRGKPRGALAEGRARVLPESESRRARAIVAGNWSLAMRPTEKGLDLIGIPMVYVEIAPAPVGEPAPAL